MAGGRIAGITIEIGGDTQGLNKALSGVNKDINKTQKELRDVNKLLKLDPKNTTLLSQKQKLLGEQIGNTKSKLEQLKTAEEQAREALEKGEIGQKEFDALQREIIETETKLKSLEKEAGNIPNAFSKIGEAGEKVKAVGGTIEGAGKKLAPVSAAAAAVGGATLKAFKDMDEGYDIVVKATGATGDALEGLKDVVDNVFSDLPVTAAEAGNAVGEVNTKFGVTGDEAAKLSEEFLKFAKITDSDVVGAVDNVDEIMKRYNIDQSEANNVMGLFAKTSQDTGISVDSLFSMVSQNGQVLQEMGLDLTDSVNLLAQFEKGGVDASTALGAMKKAQQAATKEGKTLDETMKDSMEAIKGASTETEALQIATSVFGKKGALEMTKAIRDGKISIEDISGSLNDYGGVVEQTFEDTQDPFDQATVAMNNIKVAAADLGETMLTTLEPVIKTVLDKVKEFTQWFGNLDEGTKKTIVTVIGIVAALAPVLIIVGKIIVFVGQLMTYLPAIAGAISALAGPIGIVIAIIAAVIAVGVLVIKNWDKIKKKAIEVVGMMIAKFKDFGFKLQAVWKSVQEKAKAAFDKIKTLAKGAVDKVKSIFAKIKDYLTKPFNSAKDKIKGVIDGIKTKIEGLKEKLKSIASFKWLKIPKITVSGGKAPWGIAGLGGSPPKFHLDWHRKAMDNPYLLDSPTVFGRIGNNLMAGGEAGKEIIYGHSNLLQDIRNVVDQSALLNAVGMIMNLLEQYLPNMKNDIVLDTGALVGSTVRLYDAALGKMARRR